MPYSVLPEVFKVVEQVALVLSVLLYNYSTVADLFYCAPAWSKTCLLFCHQFHSLGLESVKNTSEHGAAGMADIAEGRIVLTLLEVAFFVKGMTSDCAHSFGHSFVSQIFWHIGVRTVVVASFPFLSSLEGMLFAPGGFPAFKLSRASSSSSLSKDRLSVFCVGHCLL